MPLLDPQEITLTGGNGKEKTFILSRFPAVQGREIIAKYPTSNLPKMLGGDYPVSEETMLKLMTYVGIPMKEGVPELTLKTMELVNSHVYDWEMLAKIEMAMMEKNCSFFRKGTASDFLKDAVQKMMLKISEILTTSLAQSSPREKPLSTNSAPSTP